MLEAYDCHVRERAAQGLPPLPLSPAQVTDLLPLLERPPAGREAELVTLLSERVPPGVDEAAQVKAEFLAAVARGERPCRLLDRPHATRLLGTMLGGYNLAPLIALLDDEDMAPIAAAGLKRTLLVFDAFHEVIHKAKTNNWAKDVVESWAAAEWFTSRPVLPEELTVTLFKVAGEINTDDLSPAAEAWSRPDIPLHARSMLASRAPGALAEIAELQRRGHPVAFVGDVVGTGSSRKSAINSLLWHLGNDIPFVPNKRQGGVVIGGKIAPIFFNTAEDSGALPLECDVAALESGTVVRILPYEGRIEDREGETLTRFELRPATLADEVRAGGRIPLIIGRTLTDQVREALGLEPSELFARPARSAAGGGGYTLAQKMVGRACGLPGVRPGSYCEPRVTTVGSQDTTGGMTRDELKELACMHFAAPLVMQSFCHTAAYPRPVDIRLQRSLPDFIRARGGVSLRPGDGVIHSWLNRMLLPDTVGTGGDSHTRFPLGISFPAGSGLVAFAAALGIMPLDMPESVKVVFKGEPQRGVTLRDLVNAIPYVARQRGLLTVAKSGKRNPFSGRILEIEGLPRLKVEQAFELADASAERSAAACTVRLDVEPVAEYLRSNVALLRRLVAEGYGDAGALERRVAAMEAWLERPELLAPDADADYAEVLEIDLAEIREPLLACPDDPDDVRPLSELAGTPLDEVFIGSCMTNIGHYRAAGKVLEEGGQAPVRLWLAPPTRLDQAKLTDEGWYAVFGRAGARIEPPGCSLCMGNQARVADGATVLSTSTRNFPNRMGKGARVYLGSAEVAAVAARLGRIPSPAEYAEAAAGIDADAGQVYRYLDFGRQDGG